MVVILGSVLVLRDPVGQLEDQGGDRGIGAQVVEVGHRLVVPERHVWAILMLLGVGDEPARRALERVEVGILLGVSVQVLERLHRLALFEEVAIPSRYLAIFPDLAEDIRAELVELFIVLGRLAMNRHQRGRDGEQ